MATTIGDQLRLHYDFRSKVIGVSYKDRAAIFPAGRSANAAYWLDTKNRQFITSTYYMQELPQWAKDYNKVLAKNEEFKRVGTDVGLYPLCGHITTDMAIAALKGERLGQGDVPDMLCVSYSETDVIGHKYSPRSEHTDEAYLELDKDLARLLSALDAQVGSGNYLLFLTADHGGAQNWKFMQEHKLSAGPSLTDEIKEHIYEELASDMGDVHGIIGDIMDYRVFLNWEKIQSLGLITADLPHQIVEALRKEKHVIFACTFEDLATAALPPLLRDRALMGYYPGRSLHLRGPCHSRPAAAAARPCPHGLLPWTLGRHHLLHQAQLLRLRFLVVAHRHHAWPVEPLRRAHPHDILRMACAPRQQSP